MMNDTTKENNEKNTYTNKVCHTLLLGGELEFGKFKFYSGVVEKGQRCERGEKQKKYFLEGCPIREVSWPSNQIGNAGLQKLSHAMMRQLLLHSILLSYFTSKIFFFSANKSKHITSNLKYLKRQKVGRGHLIFTFWGEFPYQGN